LNLVKTKTVRKLKLIEAKRFDGSNLLHDVVVCLVELVGDAEVLSESLEIGLWLLRRLEVKRFEHMGKSVSAEHNLSLSDILATLDIILTWHLILLDGWVDMSLGVLESFLGPLLDVYHTGLVVSRSM